MFLLICFDDRSSHHSCSIKMLIKIPLISLETTVFEYLFNKFVGLLSHFEDICGRLLLQWRQFSESYNYHHCTTSFNKAWTKVLEIHDGEDLWRWSRLEIRLNAFRWSTIPPKQFIIKELQFYFVICGETCSLQLC